jgi:hypothetical protein
MQAIEARRWWRGNSVWFWFAALIAIVLVMWGFSMSCSSLYNAAFPVAGEYETRLPGACYTVGNTDNYFVCPQSPWEDMLRNYARNAVYIPAALAGFLTPLIFLIPLAALFLVAVLLRLILK